MTNSARTLIGIPCQETVKSRTAFDLFHLKGDVKLIMQRGADVAYNRNKWAQHAIEGKFSHLLFIDSDMSFEPDTLERMLKHDKDILGLAANRKKLPLESVVKPLNKQEENGILPKELFEVESCGTGIMLIKTPVFEYLEAPWFDFEYVDGERVGEDVSFCRLARNRGYEIWVDPQIPVRHLGEYAF